LIDSTFDKKEDMKKLLKKIWDTVKAMYENLIGRTQKYVPIAVKIVEGIKKVMDSPVDDVILAVVETAIPGDADDKMIEKVKSVVETWLPKILLELKIVDTIANIPGTNDQLQAILSEIKKLSPESQAMIYHGFASLFIEKMSDGELSWSDSIALAEYAYQNYIKPKN